MDELRDFSKAVSRLHRLAGAAALEVETGCVPRRPLLVVGLYRLAVPGRYVSPKQVRKVLWNTRRLPVLGDRCVVTWYNHGTGSSEVMLAASTWRKQVVQKLIEQYPEAALVEVPKHG